MFTLHHTSSFGRRGTLACKNGTIETPFFMPVGTVGAMKGLTFDDIEDIGAQVLLANTYHLHLRPGDTTIANLGGLHQFTNWSKPILTDSGGFQVFSFSKNGRCKIDDEGVEFLNHIDGAKLRMGPEDSIQIQHNIGADMIMCFDECPASTAPRQEIKDAVDRTLYWAERCKKYNDTKRDRDGWAPMLFGIVQGGLERDLREFCAQELIAIGFDGYAIGGLAVGESETEMVDVVKTVCPLLPDDKARYLMGVGVISQLRKCIALGIDMFDCVLPMRIARHGTIIMNDESEVRIKRQEFKEDNTPIDPESISNLSRRHSKAYLHHLLKTGERYGETIATKQNMAVTLKALQDMRNQMDTRSDKTNCNVEKQLTTKTS